MNPNHMDQMMNANKANNSTCSASSLSTISSNITSPRNSLSPNCYGNYSDSPNQAQYNSHTQHTLNGKINCNNIMNQNLYEGQK